MMKNREFLISFYALCQSRVLLSLFLVLSLFSFCNESKSASESTSESAPQRSFQAALPGYKYKFPDDHFSHNKFKTEWWYYTGHLESKEKRKFGFELTFFRSAVPITDGVKSGPWALDNIYMAHFAITDLSGKRFFHKELMSRAAHNSAGACEDLYKVWVNNWSVELKDGKHLLTAQTDGYAIKLQAEEGKPPVAHGENGISRKGSGAACASHYYSLTNMPVTGRLKFAGESFDVKGKAWMDHEFGSNQLSKGQVGWDWFSIQLDDQSELMLYVLRLKDGKADPVSSGTVISASGRSQHLKNENFRIHNLSYWQSPQSGGKYPASWQIEIPDQNLELFVEPELQDQELMSSRTGISYYEGACKVSGKKSGNPISGKAYVELTGYAREMDRTF